jgi:hypothetical protein
VSRSSSRLRAGDFRWSLRFFLPLRFDTCRSPWTWLAFPRVGSGFAHVNMINHTRCLLKVWTNLVVRSRLRTLCMFYGILKVPCCCGPGSSARGLLLHLWTCSYAKVLGCRGPAARGLLLHLWTCSCAEVFDFSTMEVLRCHRSRHSLGRFLDQSSTSSQPKVFNIGIFGGICCLGSCNFA